MRVLLKYGLQKALKCTDLRAKDIANIPLEGTIHVENGRILSCDGVLSQAIKNLGELFEKTEVVLLRLEDPTSGRNTLGKIEMHKTVLGQQYIHIVDARESDKHNEIQRIRGVLLQSHVRHCVADFCETFFPPGE